MKCLRKYKWVKLPRKEMPELKGRLGYWLKLAESVAFRKGIGTYCGHKNPVEPGMWAGGIVGVKAILGVRSRAKAFQILDHLKALGYSYAMTSYILAENPELTASEAIERSKQMMSGNRWRLFCVQISFIGWEILNALLTFGIGGLWITPYKQAATAAFYREVSGTERIITPNDAPYEPSVGGSV